MEILPLREIQSKIGEKKDKNESYGIAVIDIDFFTRFCQSFDKYEINDIMGNIRSFLKSRLHENAILRQSSGDEFIIYMPRLEKIHMKKYLGDIRKEFRKQRFARNSKRNYSNIAMTFSAGVASYPKDGLDFKEVVRKAIVALFLAKAFRRNRVFIAPNSEKKGLKHVLYDKKLKIDVAIGEYGEIGCVNEGVKASKARLWEPQAIDIDDEGNLYILDQNNNALLKYDGVEVLRIVGNGTFGYSGDGGLALNATLNKPTGLAVHGNYVYITDTGNDVARRIELGSGIIDTVAGTGEAGYSGDGNLARYANLNKPGGVVVDRKGSLYINDIANNVIRKVNEEGIISTYAGTGKYGYTGDGGLAKSATFAEIYNIGIDKRNDDIYIADYFNHCVRKIDAITGIITTVIGTGQEGYSGDGDSGACPTLNRPVAVELDSDGNLFIAESGNNCIRYLHKKTNKLYTLVGDGVYGIGKSGVVEGFRLANPNAVAIDKKNLVYILDGANNRVCSLKLKKSNI